MTTPDRAHRPVVARLETEPFPAAMWDAVFDLIAEAAASVGVMVGGHIAETGGGWQPGPRSVLAQPRIGDAETLRRRVAVLERDLASARARLRDRAGGRLAARDVAVRALADRLRETQDSLSAAVAAHRTERAEIAREVRDRVPRRHLADIAVALFGGTPYGVLGVTDAVVAAGSVEKIAELRARVAELENEICKRDGATDVAVIDAINRAERRVDDLLAGREINPSAMNAMLAGRLSRILEQRTADLADALTRIAELEVQLRDARDLLATDVEEGREILSEAVAAQRAIREAINLLGPEPCACPVSEDCAHGCGGSRAEVAEALRVLRRGLGEPEPTPAG